MLSPFNAFSQCEKVAQALLPGGGGGNNDAVAEALRWAEGKNWTHEWLNLVAEDPTVRFTHAEYLPQSSEVGMMTLFGLANVCLIGASCTFLGLLTHQAVQGDGTSQQF